MKYSKKSRIPKSRGIQFFAITTINLTTLSLTAFGEQALIEGEGYIEVTGGKVWYRIVGSGTATPILLLHGGPGAQSSYLKPLEKLGDERPVILRPTW
jgi:hypothetical protein